MFAALVAIMLLPITDLGGSKGFQFRPLSKIAFFVFVANFLVLMQLGAKHVESPFIEFGQLSTVLYFAYYILIMPGVSLIENTLIDLILLRNRRESFNNLLPTNFVLHSSIIPTSNGNNEPDSAVAMLKGDNYEEFELSVADLLPKYVGKNVKVEIIVPTLTNDKGILEDYKEVNIYGNNILYK